MEASGIPKGEEEPVIAHMMNTKSEPKRGNMMNVTSRPVWSNMPKTLKKLEVHKSGVHDQEGLER